MDRILIEPSDREFGLQKIYDTLIDDLHEQGWKTVVLEPPASHPSLRVETDFFYSVSVYLSQHVTDAVLDAIAAAFMDRLSRPREGLIRRAIIYGPSGEKLRVVELDE